ncbi:inactive rhomboid protein 1 isoform X2 [Patella vulgata]|uniref:inactive rhomboid protein 1 isoform X2 n=1 Tax=Patella vulgata TaxID=6465 RepID=UPI0024A80B0C|nr:inactive rhomboid protein 1 isoform X2 [Patella vulgata]
MNVINILMVNCLNGLCGFTGLSESTSDGFPVSPYQAWRVFVALFYCHGVIHLILILFVEWLIMRSVERSSGWLRLMLIFLISGMTSVVAASIISPYLPQVGSTGAVFGAVGVSIIEVIQAWKIINKPWKELIKIIIVITFFLISGLLPLVSNFAILTGITMGIFSSMLLLPYITLGLYERQGRIALIIISIPLLFMMFFVIFYTYVKVQNVQLCKGCQNFECVPFSDKICSYL